MQEIECHLVTSSRIVVEGEGMASVRLDIVLNNCGIGVGVLQIFWFVCPLTITLADIKIEFSQHELDRRFKARTRKP